MSKKSQKRKPIEEKKQTVPQAPAWFHKLDTDLYAVAAIAAVWLILMVLINPRGNFPLNDDWCYARAVENLIRHHEIRLVGITTMTLIAQVLWGALFCIFGFSFTALRVSTLVLGLAGLIATYALMREARAPRWAAVFGCAVVALNPLYLPLSYSFMSDVPFAALVMITVYAYLQALKCDSTKWIVIGAALAVAATFIRQLGVILPIGFALAYMVKNGVRVRTLLRTLIPLAVVVVLLLGYTQWLKASGRMPYLFNTQADSLKTFFGMGPEKWLSGVLQVFRDTYVYVGLFLLPFTIVTFHRKWQALTARCRLLTGIVSLISALGVWWLVKDSGRIMPLKRAPGDYIMDFGIGPPTLRDVFVDSVWNYPAAPHWFWLAVTAAGIIGGALLFWHLAAALGAVFSRDRERVSAQDRAFLVMLITVGVLYLSPMVPLTAFVYFDRYFLCAVPLFMVIAMLTTGPLARPSRIYVAAGLLVLLLISMYSVGGTHDYMTWNRVRWQALEELRTKDGVQPQEVDGGYEWNGWHNYIENDKSQPWWRSVYDDYAITFGPIPGYEELHSYSFRAWMPPGTGRVYVLQKTWY